MRYVPLRGVKTKYGSAIRITVFIAGGFMVRLSLAGFKLENEQNCIKFTHSQHSNNLYRSRSQTSHSMMVLCKT